MDRFPEFIDCFSCAVGESFLGARFDAHERLIHYSTFSGGDSAQKNLSGICQDWSDVFDLEYSRILASEQDTFVWRDSYDGSAISDIEMSEWLSVGVERTTELDLSNPSVLEIGCGNGLFYDSLIDGASRYVGIDSAPASLTAFAQKDSYRKFSGKTNLYELSAIDIDRFSSESFDLVILNSVVQYFENLEYFLSVLEKMPNIISRDSVVFFGDIRSLELQELFCYDVASHKISTRDLRERSANEIRVGINRKIRRERELLFSSALFRLLPHLYDWIDLCRIRVKPGIYANEMSKYRYDVLLRCRMSVAPTRVGYDMLDGAHLKMVDIENALSLVRPGAGLVINSIRNERIGELADEFGFLYAKSSPSKDSRAASYTINAFFKLFEKFKNLSIDLQNDPEYIGSLRIVATWEGETIDWAPMSIPLSDYCNRVTVHPAKMIKDTVFSEMLNNEWGEVKIQEVMPTILRFP